MAQIGRLPTQQPQQQPNIMELPDFLGAPVGVPETQEEMFKRTGSPVADPANEAPEGALPDFLGPAIEQQPDVQPYDWTAAGMPLPEALKPVGDIVAGMNNSLAKVIGAPVDLIDNLMRKVGSEGLLEQPGTARQNVIKAMESMGIAADKRKAANGFLGEIGEATGENLLMLSAFFAAAPTMLAAQGSGAMATFSRQMGEALLKHPIIAGSSEIGSAIGGETGATVGRPAGPGAEALGGIAGSMAGGVLGAINPISAITGGIKSGMSMFDDMGRAAAGALDNKPLLTDQFPTVDTISQSIKGDQARVERIIENMVGKMTQKSDPILAARQLQQVQRGAYKQARVLENGYWGKVDMKRAMPTAGVKQWRDELINATVKEGRSEWLPNDLLSDIKALPVKGASLERLRAIRTKAFQRLQSGTVPTQQGVLPLNDKLRGNLTSMIKTIDNEVDKAFPNDLELKKASGFSRWLHDRFTRGPVAQFARPRGNETTLPPARQAGRRAMQHEEFGPQTADIANELEMPAMKIAAEQLLRGQLNEEVTKLGPEAAARFLKQPSTKSFLRAYPQMAAEWQTTTSRLDKMLVFRKEVMDSQFMKVANEQPATAIRSLLSSKDRVKSARTLMQRIKAEPDAVEAAKNQMVLSLEEVAQGNPAKILEVLGNSDTRHAVRTVMGGDLDRLERIAREAAELMKTDQGVPRYLLRRGARVIGAVLGRRLNTGTLQAPEFGGRLAQRLADDWLGRVEKDIFAKAVRYPAWEAVLKARVPQSLSELGHLKTLLRRAIRVEEAAERASVPLQNELGLDDEE